MVPVTRAVAVFISYKDMRRFASFLRQLFTLFKSDNVDPADAKHYLYHYLDDAGKALYSGFIKKTLFATLESISVFLGGIIAKFGGGESEIKTVVFNYICSMVRFEKRSFGWFKRFKKRFFKPRKIVQQDVVGATVLMITDEKMEKRAMNDGYVDEIDEDVDLFFGMDEAIVMPKDGKIKLQPQKFEEFHSIKPDEFAYVFPSCPTASYETPAKVDETETSTLSAGDTKSETNVNSEFITSSAVEMLAQAFFEILAATIHENKIFCWKPDFSVVFGTTGELASQLSNFAAASEDEVQRITDFGADFGTIEEEDRELQNCEKFAVCLFSRSLFGCLYLETSKSGTLRNFVDAIVIAIPTLQRFEDKKELAEIIREEAAIHKYLNEQRSFVASICGANPLTSA